MDEWSGRRRQNRCGYSLAGGFRSLFGRTIDAHFNRYGSLFEQVAKRWLTRVMRAADELLGSETVSGQ